MSNGVSIKIICILQFKENGSNVMLAIGNSVNLNRNCILNKIVSNDKKKQVTRGHNIVADGRAGAANPHPHPTPHPTPLPTETHTQKASETLIFPLFDSCSRINGPMDGQTAQRTDQQTDGQSLL